MTEHTPTPCLLCLQRDARTPSVVCGGCYARLRTDTATVAWAHAWLRTQMLAIAPTWKPGSTHARGASRPPFAVQLHDARALIEDQLRSWATTIGEKHTPALAGPRATDVPTVTAWLLERLPWLSEQPWVLEYAIEITDLRQTAYGLAPWERTRRDLPVPCSRCGQLTLSLYAGNDGIICRDRDCAELIPWYQYEREVREWHDRATLQTAA